MAGDSIEDTLAYLVDSARAALAQGEAFVPFGAGARPGDDPPLHFDVTAEDAGDAQGAIALLVAGMRQEHDRLPLSAAGLAFVAEAEIAGAGATMALLAHVETPDGAARAMLHPFARHPEEGLVWSAPSALPADPVIFAPDPA